MSVWGVECSLIGVMNGREYFEIPLLRVLEFCSTIINSILPKCVSTKNIVLCADAECHRRVCQPSICQSTHHPHSRLAARDKDTPAVCGESKARKCKAQGDAS
jgi:hypothetical protein